MELIRRFDCTLANVMQLLSEDSNLRLESVARNFHAVGDTYIVGSSDLGNEPDRGLIGDGLRK